MGAIFSTNLHRSLRSFFIVIVDGIELFWIGIKDDSDNVMLLATITLLGTYCVSLFHPI